MSNFIKPRSRRSDDIAPTTAQLVDGEIAINVPSRKIYFRDQDEIIEIANAAGTEPVPHSLVSANNWFRIETDMVADSGEASKLQLVLRGVHGLDTGSENGAFGQWKTIFSIIQVNKSPTAGFSHLSCLSFGGIAQARVGVYNGHVTVWVTRDGLYNGFFAADVVAVKGTVQAKVLSAVNSTSSVPADAVDIPIDRMSLDNVTPLVKETKVMTGSATVNWAEATLPQQSYRVTTGSTGYWYGSPASDASRNYNVNFQNIDRRAYSGFWISNKDAYLGHYFMWVDERGQIFTRSRTQTGDWWTRFWSDENLKAAQLAEIVNGSHLNDVTSFKASIQLSGTNTGDQTTITGNAGSATVLQTARTINGVSFNGSANITITAASPSALTIGNGLTGTNYTGAAASTVALGTPSDITLASTNAVSATSHSHAFKPGGTTSQYIRGDGTLASFPAIPAGTVTSVAAGNGLNFTTITGTGSVTLGTPSNITLTSVNGVSADSHTHNFAPGGTTAQYIRGDGTLAAFPAIPAGTVTSVSAGNGMVFTTISNTGSVALGTPSTLSGSTTNSVTTNSHTHELSVNLKAWDGITPSSKADASALTSLVPNSRSITAGNGLTGGGTLASDVSVSLGTPSNITLSSTNATTATSHTHNFVPGGTADQYIRGNGTLADFPTQRKFSQDTDPPPNPNPGDEWLSPSMRRYTWIMATSGSGAWVELDPAALEYDFSGNIDGGNAFSTYGDTAPIHGGGAF